MKVMTLQLDCLLKSVPLNSLLPQEELDGMERVK